MTLAVIGAFLLLALFTFYGVTGYFIFRTWGRD